MPISYWNYVLFLSTIKPKITFPKMHPILPYFPTHILCVKSLPQERRKHNERNVILSEPLFLWPHPMFLRERGPDSGGELCMCVAWMSCVPPPFPSLSILYFSLWLGVVILFFSFRGGLLWLGDAAPHSRKVADFLEGPTDFFLSSSRSA